MTQPVDAQTATPNDDPRDRRAAGAVIGAHSLKHLYQAGFYVILPELYRSLDMNPVSAGAVEAVRRGASGASSMAGGIALDRYPEKRVPTLYVSLILMGFGYLLVGLAPSYVMVLVAVGIAGGGGSVWHPAALGLLSEKFPARRGFVIALHRSSGSAGDVIGPLLVGGLLLAVSTQAILIGAMPPAVLLALILWLFLARAPGWDSALARPEVRRSFRDQFRAMGPIMRDRGLRMLVVVKIFSGLGQGGLVMWIGLYLANVHDVGSMVVAVHVALLMGFGIVAGPLVGSLSDRIGRRPVIASVLALKAVAATIMALVGYGILFSVLVAVIGSVLYAVNSLIQAAALDVGDGQKLEGSILGVMWGINAVASGLSPLAIGALIAWISYDVLFWYVAIVNAAGTLAALGMPRTAPKSVSAT